MAERDTGAAAAAVGIADELTVNTSKGKGRLKNENSDRTTESTSGHWPFSGLRPRAGVCVFACRRTAVDPAATRRLRTGCDATLQSVRPGRSACLSLHVPLPTLPQPRLPRRILRRPEKEAEAPLRSPITGLALCRPFKGIRQGYGVTVRVTLRLRFEGRLRSYVTLRGSIRTRTYVTRRNLLTAA
jgi:hypothetical protein